ncbi:putative MscS family protein YkuT [Ferriphaselus amnicola]|uniref:Putative MscS family protein YkuT n=2 Tax=Ferriphaselus amnicola TaxID=1188319 RepID=A0A2Z6GC60_9PROT|nr:putative MscS family protein YkuT [Ferriphaselus amnicola]
MISNFLHTPKELLHVGIILLLAWLLMQVGLRLVQLFRSYMYTRADSAEDKRRIETLARVFHHIITVIITLVAGMLALSELGISIAPILGAAGVVGIAVGFGAQSLIKDYFNGFFILIENQIRQGDVVEVGGKTGVVEDITLRYVSLRDYEGSVHYIPNGLITTVTNKSRGFAYAVIDVSVAYRESIEEVYDVIREVSARLRVDSLIGEKILEDIEIAGVQDWADSAIVLRCRFKTVALEQWCVRREFLKCLKIAFDVHGIEIPYPHLTLYAGTDKQGNTSPFRIVRQDR